MPRTLLHDPTVAAVLDAGAFCHLGVDAATGPHVTPEAYVVHDGRLWCTTSRTSVKARVLAQRPHVGFVVRDGDRPERSVIGVGRVQRFDLGSPLDQLRSARLGPGALPLALGAYAARNARYLLGYLLDVTHLPREWLLHNRVALAVEPSWLGVLHGGDLVADVGHRAPTPLGRKPGPTPPIPELRTTGTPPHAAAVVSEDGPVMVGLPARGGPVVVPGLWSAASGTAAVAAAGIRALGVGVADVAGAHGSITLDRADPVHPTKMTGLLLRGPAWASTDRAGWVDVAVDAERATWWEGWQSGTVDRSA